MIAAYVFVGILLGTVVGNFTKEEKPEVLTPTQCYQLCEEVKEYNEIKKRCICQKRHD